MYDPSMAGWRLLTKRDVARILGLCERSIDNLVRRGDLVRPGYVTTVTPRWDPRDVAAYTQAVGAEWPEDLAAQPPDDNPRLSPSQTARVLGLDLKTVRRHRYFGIQTHRWGRSQYARLSAILDWWEGIRSAGRRAA
jgi:hypothetical protein